MVGHPTCYWLWLDFWRRLSVDLSAPMPMWIFFWQIFSFVTIWYWFPLLVHHILLNASVLSIPQNNWIKIIFSFFSSLFVMQLDMPPSPIRSFICIAKWPVLGSYLKHWWAIALIFSSGAENSIVRETCMSLRRNLMFTLTTIKQAVIAKTCHCMKRVRDVL